MRQWLALSASFLFGSLVATSVYASSHADIVVESGDAIPGEAGRTFESFAPPVLVDGMLAFSASDDLGGTGIYWVATDATGAIGTTIKWYRPNPIPTGPPPSLGIKMSLSADSMIVDALTAAGAPAILGVDLVSGSAVYVVQVGDSIPAQAGAADTFQKIGDIKAAAVADRVLFQGDGATRRGIYTADLGAAGIKLLVDNSMSSPDGFGLFTAFGGVSGDADQVVFQATSQMGQGVYAVTDAAAFKYAPIANTGMNAPSSGAGTAGAGPSGGGTGATFANFGDIEGESLDDKGKAIFVAQTTDGGEGLYATPDFVTMKLWALADTTTPLPGAPMHKFSSFYGPSLSADGHKIGFLALGTDGSRSIYSMLFEEGAVAHKEFTEGTTFLEKKISELRLSRQALGSLGLVADFQDSSSAVLLEPDSAIGVPVLPHAGLVVLAALALLTGAWSVWRGAARRTAS